MMNAKIKNIFFEIKKDYFDEFIKITRNDKRIDSVVVFDFGNEDTVSGFAKLEKSELLDEVNIWYEWIIKNGTTYLTKQYFLDGKFWRPRHDKME